jgi:hypothetical protein
MWSVVLPRAKLAWGRNSMRWKYTNVEWNVGVCGFRMSAMNRWRGACAASVMSSAAVFWSSRCSRTAFRNRESTYQSPRCYGLYNQNVLTFCRSMLYASKQPDRPSLVLDFIIWGLRQLSRCTDWAISWKVRGSNPSKEIFSSPEKYWAVLGPTQPPTQNAPRPPARG